MWPAHGKNCEARCLARGKKKAEEASAGRAIWTRKTPYGERTSLAFFMASASAIRAGMPSSGLWENGLLERLSRFKKIFIDG